MKAGVRRLAGFAVALASTLCALLLGELAARALTPERRGVSWYHYDERYEFRHRPSLDVVTTEWGDGARWRFRTNSRGFRGGEWGSRMKPGTWRLLVAGDSFTVGDGVEEAETFPAVAERLLGERATGVAIEVVNLGVSAWGPENQLAWLGTEGGDVQGSCLVSAFYLGNDLVDHRRSGLYELQAGKLEKRPVRSERGGKLAPTRRLVRRLPGYEWLLAHSQLFNVARWAAIDRLARPAGPVAEGGQPIEGLTAGGTLESALLAKDAAHVGAVLDEMNRIARERFGCFGILLVPAREMLRDQRVQSSVAVGLAVESRRWMKEWSEAAGVPLRDATAAFPVDAAAVAGLFFQRDFHMNARGNALLGAELASFARVLQGGSPSPAGSRP